MKKLLLSGVAAVLLATSVHAATTQLGVLQIGPGVPPPYTFDMLASGGSNIGVQDVHFGSWIFSMDVGTNFTNTMSSSVKITQSDNTKEDVLVLGAWSLGNNNPSNSYTSIMTWLGTLPDNFDVYLANYAQDWGAQYYDNGLALYSAGQPIKLSAAGTVLFGAAYPNFNTCVECATTEAWHIASHPIPVSPVPLPAALPMFLAGLIGIGALARCRRKAVSSLFVRTEGK